MHVCVINKNLPTIFNKFTQRKYDFIHLSMNISLLRIRNFDVVVYLKCTIAKFAQLSRRIERDFHSRRDANSRLIDSIGGRLADREQIE